MRSRLIAYHIDRITKGFIEGWICDANAPNVGVEYELFFGAQRVASGVADTFRADLRVAGYGEGNCAFRASLDPKIMASARGPLSLVVGDTVLQIADEITAKELFAPKVLGEVDSVTTRSIGGWMLDEADPDNGSLVELWVDGHRCAQATAEQVLADGTATRKWGFVLDVELLNLHRTTGVAEIRVGETVIGSISLPLRQFDGSIDYIGEDGVYGWVRDRADPTGRLTVVIRSLDEEGREYAAMSNLYNDMLRGRFNFVFHRPSDVPAGRYQVALREGGSPFEDVVIQFFKPAPNDVDLCADLICAAAGAEERLLRFNRSRPGAAGLGIDDVGSSGPPIDDREPLEADLRSTRRGKRQVGNGVNARPVTRRRVRPEGRA
jgi:hypothetical protein